MRRWKQTPNIVRALWEPLCLAALNEPVESGSAALFATVIRQSFLGSAEDSKIYVSRVGLSELFAPEVRRLLEMCGSRVRMQAPVTGLHFDDGAACGKSRWATARRCSREAVVSALPWHVLRGLLPAESKLAGACRALGRCADRQPASLARSPRAGRAVRRLSRFAGALGLQPRSHPGRYGGPAGPRRHRRGQRRPRRCSDLAPAELEELTLRELRRFLPAAREAQVLHRMVYKARSATFAATPEAETLRPGA